VELESQRARFGERGLEVAALSYDSVTVLKEFAVRRGISYTLLSDPESAIIRRFGLLNPDYPAGDRAHGVPYPGTFVVDAEGVIREKYFAREYTERRTAGSVLTPTEAVPEGATERVTPHFRLRSWASNLEVVPGQRVTLALEIDLQPGHHVYAAGEHRYRALALKLTPSPYIRLDALHLPTARPFEFAPLKETVPVFEGRFRVTQDVVVAVRDDIAPLLASSDPTILIEGTVEYQVCSETVCHPPGSLPVSWSLRVRPLDRERSPAGRARPDRP
jgi:hypothetical protein